MDRIVMVVRVRADVNAYLCYWVAKERKWALLNAITTGIKPKGVMAEHSFRGVGTSGDTLLYFIAGVCSVGADRNTGIVKSLSEHILHPWAL